MYAFTLPLDITRTRLAVDVGREPAQREFKGLVDCMYKVARRDGIAGLYRFVCSHTYFYLISYVQRRYSNNAIRLLLSRLVLRVSDI